MGYDQSGSPVLVPYFLFGLECYSRASLSIRSIGGAIIAMENPAYVGRLMFGTDVGEDKSALLIEGRPTVALFQELQRIGEHRGAEVTPDYPELWALFSDPQMTTRRTTVVFHRHERQASFKRGPERYERRLREFVQELIAREL